MGDFRFKPGLIRYGEPGKVAVSIVEDLRLALLAFRNAYNTTGLIQRHGFRTPAQVRQQQFSAVAIRV